MPNTLKKDLVENMFSVIIVNRSMNDFVTSNTAEMLFDTRRECEDYIKNSEGFHPGRFFYHIKERAQTMKLVYAISRWSNPYRSAARHIDNGSGLPLCGGAGRKAFCWETEDGEPTCARCIKQSAQHQKTSLVIVGTVLSRASQRQRKLENSE